MDMIDLLEKINDRYWSRFLKEDAQPMNLKYFSLLVGLPAVGKSTWVNANYLDSYVVLSSDAIIEELSAQKGITYDQGFTQFVDIAQKKFFDNVKTALAEGRNVMIDRTNLTVKSRKRLLDMVPADYKKVAVVFDCSPEEQARRLASRPGKSIPAHVIKNMRDTYQEPTEAEGFSSITKINTNTVEEE